MPERYDINGNPIGFFSVEDEGMRYVDPTVIQPAVVSANRNYWEAQKWARENVRDPRERTAPYVAAGLGATIAAPFMIEGAVAGGLAAANSPTMPLWKAAARRMAIDIPAFEAVDRLPQAWGDERFTTQGTNLIKQTTPIGRFAPWAVDVSGPFIAGMVPGMVGDMMVRGTAAGVNGILNGIGRRIANNRMGYLAPMADVMNEGVARGMTNLEGSRPSSYGDINTLLATGEMNPAEIDVSPVGTHSAPADLVRDANGRVLRTPDGYAIRRGTNYTVIPNEAGEYPEFFYDFVGRRYNTLDEARGSATPQRVPEAEIQSRVDRQLDQVNRLNNLRQAVRNMDDEELRSLQAAIDDITSEGNFETLYEVAEVDLDNSSYRAPLVNRALADVVDEISSRRNALNNAVRPRQGSVSAAHAGVPDSGIDSVGYIETRIANGDSFEDVLHDFSGSSADFEDELSDLMQRKKLDTTGPFFDSLREALKLRYRNRDLAGLFREAYQVSGRDARDYSEEVADQFEQMLLRRSDAPEKEFERVGWLTEKFSDRDLVNDFLDNTPHGMRRLAYDVGSHVASGYEKLQLDAIKDVISEKATSRGLGEIDMDVLLDPSNPGFADMSKRLRYSNVAEEYPWDIRHQTWFQVKRAEDRVKNIEKNIALSAEQGTAPSKAELNRLRTARARVTLAKAKAGFQNLVLSHDAPRGTAIATENTSPDSYRNQISGVTHADFGYDPGQVSLYAPRDSRGDYIHGHGNPSQLNSIKIDVDNNTFEAYYPDDFKQYEGRIDFKRLRDFFNKSNTERGAMISNGTAPAEDLEMFRGMLNTLRELNYRGTNKIIGRINKKYSQSYPLVPEQQFNSIDDPKFIIAAKEALRGETFKIPMDRYRLYPVKNAMGGFIDRLNKHYNGDRSKIVQAMQYARGGFKRDEVSDKDGSQYYDIVRQRRNSVFNALIRSGMSADDAARLTPMIVTQQTMEGGWVLNRKDNNFGGMKINGTQTISYDSEDAFQDAYIKMLDSKWHTGRDAKYSWRSARDLDDWARILNREDLGLHTEADWKKYNKGRQGNDFVYLYAPEWANDNKTYRQHLRKTEDRTAAYLKMVEADEPLMSISPRMEERAVRQMPAAPEQPSQPLGLFRALIPTSVQQKMPAAQNAPAPQQAPLLRSFIPTSVQKKMNNKAGGGLIERYGVDKVRAAMQKVKR